MQTRVGSEASNSIAMATPALADGQSLGEEAHFSDHNLNQLTVTPRLCRRSQRLSQHRSNPHCNPDGHSTERPTGRQARHTLRSRTLSPTPHSICSLSWGRRKSMELRLALPNCPMAKRSTKLELAALQQWPTYNEAREENQRHGDWKEKHKHCFDMN